LPVPDASPTRGTPDGAAGGDGAATDGAAQDAPQYETTFASNGAPIPPVDPNWNCDRLGIQLADTCQDGTCPTVTCDHCPTMLIAMPTATVVVLEAFPCNAGFRCVASVSCRVACDVGDDVFNVAATCVLDGVCTTDQDCGVGETCVPVPGQTHGACSGHGLGAPCFVDSDCTSSACVAGAGPGNRRHCTDRTENSACNRPSHCAAGRCLFNSADQFSGLCTKGSFGDPCVGTNDCKAELQLECANGKCLDANLANCNVDSECASGMCALGHCTDGQLGHPCLTSAQCAPGLQCSTSEGDCFQPLPNGSACLTAEQCASGLCRPSLDADASLSCAAM
jgi:hypothetical protein